MTAQKVIHNLIFKTHGKIYVLIGELRDMRTTDRKTYEVIVKHKEYFDARTIEIIENLMKDNENSLRIISKKDAVISKQNSHILALENKVADQSKIIDSYAFKKKEDEITIDELRYIINGLCNNLDIMRKNIEELEKDNDELKKSNDELKKDNNNLNKELDKIKKSNSSNSNMPSSFDVLSHCKKKVTNSRVKSGKKPGGQKGHVAHRSSLSNSKNCNVINRYVKKAPQAAEAVFDENDNLLYYRTQEVDLNITTTITETRYFIDEIDGEELPKEILSKYKINPLTYSTSFKSIMIYLNQRGTIPYKRLCEIMDEISDGQILLKESSLVNWSNEFKKKSDEFIKEITEDILKEKVAHVDETGCKINAQRYWMQVATSKKSALIMCVKKRGDKQAGIIKQFEGYDKIICHDFFKPYYNLQSCIHCQCNAHINRYLKSGIDFDNNEACKQILEILTEALNRKYELISQNIYKMDEQEIEDIKNKMIDIMEKEMEDYRIKNPDIKEKSKFEADHIKLFRRMIERIEEHLLFLRDFDAPYTNNEAEKLCRSIKLKKNISYQFKSVEGAEAYASIMSIIMTARKNGNNALKEIEKVMG